MSREKDDFQLQIAMMESKYQSEVELQLQIAMMESKAEYVKERRGLMQLLNGQRKVTYKRKKKQRQKERKRREKQALHYVRDFYCIDPSEQLELVAFVLSDATEKDMLTRTLRRVYERDGEERQEIETYYLLKWDCRLFADVPFVELVNSETLPLRLTNDTIHFVRTISSSDMMFLIQLSGGIHRCLQYDMTHYDYLDRFNTNIKQMKPQAKNELHVFLKRLSNICSLPFDLSMIIGSYLFRLLLQK